MNLEAIQAQIAQKKAEAEERRREEEAELEALQAALERAAMDTILAEDEGHIRVRKSGICFVLASGRFVDMGTNEYRIAGHFGTPQPVRISVTGMDDAVADALTKRLVDAVAEAVRAFRSETDQTLQPLPAQEVPAEAQKPTPTEAQKPTLPTKPTARAPFETEFSRRLAAWYHDETSLSLPQVCWALGCHQTTFSRWTKGAPVETKYVDRLAELTGIPREVVDSVSVRRGRPRGSAVRSA